MRGVERDLLVVSCAVSAGVHAALAPEHWREGAPAGVAFAVAALVLAILALALTRGRSDAAVAGGALVLGGLVAAWALAVTTGVPLLHPHAEAVEPVAVATKAVELAGVVVAVRLLRGASPSGRPIPAGLAALIAVFGALAALLVSSGSAGHVHDAAAFLP